MTRGCCILPMMPACRLAKHVAWLAGWYRVAPAECMLNTHRRNLHPIYSSATVGCRVDFIFVERCSLMKNIYSNKQAANKQTTHHNQVVG